jgi:hypothetical protein
MRDYPPLTFLLAALLCAGCALRSHQEGLLQVTDRRVMMQTAHGGNLRLVPGQEAEVLSNLGGCLAEVEGPRLIRWMWVSTWRVRDAGDGSEPYIGHLGQHGSNLVLDDANSGMKVVISEGSMSLLQPYVGKQVLVSGYIVGPQVIQVVSFRVIGD